MKERFKVQGLRFPPSSLRLRRASRVKQKIEIKKPYFSD
jgi:hypothetical protein